MFNLIVINVFEIIAAITGAIFISKRKVDKFTKYLVYFLWLTVLIELIFGWLPTAIETFEIFSTLKDTIFAKNVWIYNIYDIISFTFYLFYFINLIELNWIKRNGKYVVIIYIFCSILNLFTSGVFFENSSAFNAITGTFLLVLIIVYYFFEILNSEKILNFYRFMPFYISIGALVFHLIVNPIFIYQKYYINSISKEFVSLFLTILTTINVFMYSCYSLGFIICSRKNKSS